MKAYMIIAKVDGVEYLTKVEAESASAAEHMILDKAYCGKHEYGVEACMAYDAEGMKTDCFIGNALYASPISLENLEIKICYNNDRIRAKDAAEKEIEAIEKEMKALQKRLENAKKVLNS